MGVLDKFRDAFTKKEEPTKEHPREDPVINPPPQQRTPVVQWIIDQKTAGKTEEEVVSSLMQAGHAPEAIQQAMHDANVAMGIEPMKEQVFPEIKKDDMKTQFGQNVESYEPSKYLAEIENMVDDKVKKIGEDLSEITKWKLSVDGDLEKLTAGIDQLNSLIKDSRDKEKMKFDEYDRHLSEVKVELKATQEVFRKGLPEFTKGIQELSRIVKRKKSE
jgi:hypothetical protein